MIEDVIDGANWLMARDTAEPKRLGIYGRSYGGLLPYVALLFIPTSLLVVSIMSVFLTWSPC